MIMAYINLRADINEQTLEQLRKFKANSKGTDYKSWYRVQRALARARESVVYHDEIENYILPNIFDDEGNAMDWYHSRDPQQVQVNMLERNLKVASQKKRKRGRVTKKRLEMLLRKIILLRLNHYYAEKMDKKLKIMCIVGESGCGKTLASLHLKYKLGANVICSFTTRPPRPTEVEGRDHHFIDIVPDMSELIAYTRFAGNIYYAAKWQVFGPCTVYVIDEKGLALMKEDYSDEYDIYTVLLKRKKLKRRHAGVTLSRMNRDIERVIDENDYDYVVENNSTKKALFNNIERIYNEIKEK